MAAGSDEEFYIEESDGEQDAREYDIDADALAMTPTSSAAEFAEVVAGSQIWASVYHVVKETADFCGLPPALALLLLMQNKWDKDIVVELFLNNPNKICTKSFVKLPDARPPSPSGDTEVLCGVCFVPTQSSETSALNCGHRFCNECWHSYLSSRIVEASCVRTKCMHKDCLIRVDTDLIKRVCTPEEQSRFETFLTLDFVKGQPNFKWCPNPRSCEAVATYRGFGRPLVKCVCTYVWCFNCSQELHAPCKCEVVATWNKKCVDSGETTAWLLANTKPCPKCKTPIEKNKGCMHMTCASCRHQFCWLCRGDWSEHGTATGGFYACNKYESSSFNKEDARVSTIKANHDRYLHYFERFHNHARARDFAEKLYKVARSKSEEYTKQTGWNGEFLVEAAELVIKCRHALKWSYVYGFYLNDGPEKSLFEDQQMNLEKTTEHLTHLTESPLLEVNPADLKNYTRVTRNYLNNLVSAWEGGQSIL